MESRAELSHYGIQGMKWGVRRYQNSDGSLTSAGKKHYGVGEFSNDAKNKKSKSLEVGVVPSRSKNSAQTKDDKAAAKEAKKAQKEQKAAEKEAKKAEKERAEWEKNHQKALEARDSSQLSKYVKYLSDEEVQARINRVKKERELTGMYAEQTNERYFNGRKAIGQAAMTTISSGIGSGGAEVAKSATIYAGKQVVKSLLGEEVYREMFPPKKNNGNNNNNGSN